MKILLVILLILVAVVLAVLFGPTKPEPQQNASPAQPPAVAGPRPGQGAPPPGQAQPTPSPRQQGELSRPAQATGVTTDTVNLGGGGATFEAKRRMTDKIQQLSPSGGKPKR